MNVAARGRSRSLPRSNGSQKLGSGIDADIRRRFNRCCRHLQNPRGEKCKTRRHRNVGLSPCLRARWSRSRPKAAMKLNNSSSPKRQFIGFPRYRREENALRIWIGIDGAIEHLRWSKESDLTFA